MRRVRVDAPRGAQSTTVRSRGTPVCRRGPLFRRRAEALAWRNGIGAGAESANAASEDAERAALAYLVRGWSVVPIEVGGKRPLGPWEAFQGRLPRREELRAWLSGRSRRSPLGCSRCPLRRVPRRSLADWRSPLRRGVRRGERNDSIASRGAGGSGPGTEGSRATSARPRLVAGHDGRRPRRAAASPGRGAARCPRGSSPS